MFAGTRWAFLLVGYTGKVMCGRTSLYVPRRDLERRFDAQFAPDVEYRPRFNIPPGEPLEVITNDQPDVITQFRWGLVPHWMDEPGEGFINARSETAHEKPAFRDAWKHRPCLVPSSGFYEWGTVNGGPKQPHRVYREDDPVFAMAGLWDTREDPEDGRLVSVTILTTDPNDLVRPIHDRMPVVLRRADETTWLKGRADERRALCRPYPDDDLAAYPVSTRVNDPKNDDALVIEPLDTHQTGLGEFA